MGSRKSTKGDIFMDISKSVHVGWASLVVVVVVMSAKLSIVVCFLLLFIRWQGGYTITVLLFYVTWIRRKSPSSSSSSSKRRRISAHIHPGIEDISEGPNMVPVWYGLADRQRLDRQRLDRKVWYEWYELVRVVPYHIF